MDWASLLAFAGFAAATMAAASTGAIFKPGDWYEALAKPSWTPPNWAFPVVWTTLYLMITVAAWLVWRASGFAGAGLALALWLIQLALNAGWSWVFFGLRRMRAALWEAAALWLSVAATLLAFAQHSALAAILFAPYLLWVSVAVALNREMMRLNPRAA